MNCIFRIIKQTPSPVPPEHVHEVDGITLRVRNAVDGRLDRLGLEKRPVQISGGSMKYQHAKVAAQESPFVKVVGVERVGLGQQAPLRPPFPVVLAMVGAAGDRPCTLD